MTGAQITNLISSRRLAGGQPTNRGLARSPVMADAGDQRSSLERARTCGVRQINWVVLQVAIRVTKCGSMR